MRPRHAGHLTRSASPLSTRCRGAPHDGQKRAASKSSAKHFGQLTVASRARQ
jgi:hypothetical protein